MKPFGRSDFDRVFQPQARFYQSDGKTIIVRQELIGMLTLPSGRIVACDPGLLLDLDATPAFVHHVTPGTYPVIAAFTSEDDDPTSSNVLPVALRIDLLPDPPHVWELALFEDSDFAALPLGHFVGIGIDGGVVAVLDATLARAIHEQNDEALILHPARPWTYTQDRITPLPLIACTAGYGDGAYPRFILSKPLSPHATVTVQYSLGIVGL